MSHLVEGHTYSLSKAPVLHSTELRMKMKIVARSTNFTIWWKSLYAQAFQACRYSHETESTLEMSNFKNKVGIFFMVCKRKITHI
jgi:hypothetical protein